MATLPNRNILDGSAAPTTAAMKTAMGQVWDFLNATLEAGSAAAPSVAVGGQSNGLYSASSALRVSFNGIQVAAFGRGFSVIGSGAPNTSVFHHLLGNSASTSSQAYGQYNLITWTTDGTKNTDIRANQTKAVLIDDGSVRSISAVSNYNSQAPDVTALTPDSTVKDFKHFLANGVSSTAITVAYGYYTNVSKVAETTRWNFYAAGDAPNYFGGDVTFGGSINKTPTRSTVASGSTIVLTTSTNTLLYDNASTAAALTITLPSSGLTNGQEISIATRSAITALTVNGGTIYGAPTTLAAGGFATFIYSSTGAAWFRKG